MKLELYDRFAKSDYGRDLEQKVRFDAFKPAATSNTTWCELLGDDVNNLRHMAHTAMIAETFAAQQNLSGDDTRRLLTVAQTHDFGEAIEGDIPLPDKTAADEHRERDAYKLISCELFGDEIGTELTKNVWRVLMREDEEMGAMFNAVEYIGYAQTALRAEWVASTLAHDMTPRGMGRLEAQALTSSLSGLSRLVQAKNFPVLSQHAKRFSAVGDIMRQPISPHGLHLL